MKCKFSHDRSSASETRTPPQSSQQNAPSSPTLTTHKTRSARKGNALKNVCDFYWNTGQCERGFDCTFRHQKSTNPQSAHTVTAGETEDEEEAANAALDFFAVENLAQMAGVGLYSIQEGTPENAHNLIKRYIGGETLNTPSDMKPLGSILASVNRRNRSWVSLISMSAPYGY
jgi:hypothetical protein